VRSGSASETRGRGEQAELTNRTWLRNDRWRGIMWDALKLELN
jgi:hypothetical protein